MEGERGEREGTPPREEMLVELVRADGAVDGRPTWPDVADRVSFSRNDLRDAFGSWREALETMGYECPDTTNADGEEK